MRSSHVRLGTPIIVGLFVAAACTSAASPTPVVTSPAASPTSPPPVTTATPTSPSPAIATPEVTTPLAVAGAVDPTFGRDGFVTTDISGSGSEEHASTIAIDREGRIVVAGRSGPDEDEMDSLALARYDPDGRLDPSFGLGGIVTTAINGSELVIDADGRIVIAGSMQSGEVPGGSDFAVARYAADGSLDPTFGRGGLVTTDFRRKASLDAAHALTIDAEGRLVVAGSSALWDRDQELGGTSSSDFALARYTADGSLDPTFGRGGLVKTHFSGAGGYDFGLAMAIDTDSRIVVAGSTRDGGGNPSPALARYGPDGALDRSFGNGGLVVTDVSRLGGDEGSEHGAIAIDAGGRIVAVLSDFGLARYDPDGTLDPTFGVDGLVTTDFSDGRGSDAVHAITFDTDRRIVVAGSSAVTGADFALARYDPDGTLDPTFGEGGLVTTDFSDAGGHDIGWAIAIDADGRIVVAGETFAGSDSDFGLARYYP
ncbi:MAG TPA: hypothetical protein VM243_05125 [Phycisphaerae bacterium]|nr:hypothetical protein [Phycisphaerae bacterium]